MPLAKLYIPEVGASWMNTVMVAAQYCFISSITPVEMASLIARRERNNLIGSDAASNLVKLFNLHARHKYATASFNDLIVRAAQRLARRHELRTLDSIQLASGLNVFGQTNAQLTFISADERLLAAAAAEGLATDNPLHHA